MSIRVSCPCGKTLKVKDDAAGKRVRCPCGMILTVPSATASRTDSEEGFLGALDAAVASAKKPPKTSLTNSLRHDAFPSADEPDDAPNVPRNLRGSENRHSGVHFKQQLGLVENLIAIGFFIAIIPLAIFAAFLTNQWASDSTAGVVGLGVFVVLLMILALVFLGVSRSFVFWKTKGGALRMRTSYSFMGSPFHESPPKDLDAYSEIIVEKESRTKKETSPSDVFATLAGVFCCGLIGWVILKSAMNLDFSTETSYNVYSVYLWGPKVTRVYLAREVTKRHEAAKITERLAKATGLKISGDLDNRRSVGVTVADKSFDGVL